MTYAWTMPMRNGGMANVIAADPLNRDGFAVGGDTWGLDHTQDAADTWIPCMAGASSIGALYARGVRYSQAHPGDIYYAIGTLKGGGGAFITCNGVNYQRRSTTVAFGTSLSSGAAGVMPRPVGNMIDVLMSGSTEVIWAASAKGIAHSTDGGHNWTVIPATAATWKAIAAIDAADAIAARYETSGLTLIKGGVASHPTAPGVIHDLVNIGGTVWACGPGALYRWTGSQLQKLPTTFFSNHVPVSISGAGSVIAVGVADAASAALSEDGGNTWRWLSGARTPTNWDGSAFWLDWANNGFGGSRYACSQVAVSPIDPACIMFAGRNGVWGTRDAGAHVHPCGPAGDEVNGLRAGPGPEEFTGTDVDWVGIHTTDGFKTVKRITNPGSCPASLTAQAAGHKFQVTGGTPRDILRDGVSIADDTFRGGSALAHALAASSDGTVALGLYGGGVLVGRP